MKTKLIEALNRPAPFKAVLVVLVPCILGTLTMRAGDQTYNMDDDPHEMPGLLIFGNHEPAAWQPNDGDPALGGYFSFADAVSGQNTAVVLPQMDLFTNADGSIVDMPIKAFKLELDLRMGNGSERPADGFSISFCHLNDPVLTVASNYVTGSGMDITSGFAGGDSPELANDPNGSANVENGTKTGLAIVLDTYEGNWLPMNGVATDLNEFGSNDRQGIAVRVNDVTLVQVSLPDRNGNCTDPVCADFACADPNSLQTGPYTGDGSYAPLCWQHLSVELNSEKQLTIVWKGNTVLDHYRLTSWHPSAGRFVLAGRTGAAWQNCHVDNVHLSTTVQEPKLSMSLAADGSIGINSSRECVLQAADDAAGPYYNVGQGTTFSVNPQENHKFFRGAVSAGVGSVSGRITDPAGDPLPGLNVELPYGGPSTTTEVDGTFRLDGAPAGLTSLDITVTVTFEDPVSGVTNTIIIRIPIQIPVKPGVTVQVEVKVVFDAGGGAVAACGCAPFCNLFCEWDNGRAQVVAVGGKMGACAEEPAVLVTFIPSSGARPSTFAGSKFFKDAKDGTYMISTSICGRTCTKSITVPGDCTGCKCTPKSELSVYTDPATGTTTLMAEGGSSPHDECPAQVTLTGPNGETYNSPGAGWLKTIKSPANGIWTLTVTVCGQTIMDTITVP